MISIILPTYLGYYNGCATNRELKLQRAIDSVLNQTYKNFELIIICDGCEESFNIASKYNSEKIKVYLIEKQIMWSGVVRNFGLKKATGDIVVYLDSDDYFGKDHLQVISNNFTNLDWAYFNDFICIDKSFIERDCHITAKYQHGTSNIAHKRELKAIWEYSEYGHDDYNFVMSLMNLSSNYGKIKTPQYHVCHIPNKYDV
jgi:glycosyltransferase involved in cell wall biosynthesis